MAKNQGDDAAAQAYYEEILTTRREVGDRQVVASALNNLGNLAGDRTDYAAAQAYYEESLTLYREIGDSSSTALLLTNLGIAVKSQGDYASARTLQEESLAIFRAIGEYETARQWRCTTWGALAQDQDDHALARAYYEESLTLCTEIGERRGMAMSLHSLGQIDFAQNDHGSARAYYAESLTLRKEIGYERDIVLSLEAYAELAAREGRSESAAVLWGSGRSPASADRRAPAARRTSKARAGSGLTPSGVGGGGVLGRVERRSRDDVPAGSGLCSPEPVTLGFRDDLVPATRGHGAMGNSERLQSENCDSWLW